MLQYGEFVVYALMHALCKSACIAGELVCLSGIWKQLASKEQEAETQEGLTARAAAHPQLCKMQPKVKVMVRMHHLAHDCVLPVFPGAKLLPFGLRHGAVCAVYHRAMLLFMHPLHCCSVYGIRGAYSTPALCTFNTCQGCTKRQTQHLPCLYLAHC